MAAVRQGHPFWGSCQIEWAVEATSLPRAPPAVKTAIHTQHGGDMAMTGSLNDYRGAGPAEATELPPHFQGGPGAASQVMA